MPTLAVIELVKTIFSGILLVLEDPVFPARSLSCLTRVDFRHRTHHSELERLPLRRSSSQESLNRVTSIETGYLPSSVGECDWQRSPHMPSRYFDWLCLSRRDIFILAALSAVSVTQNLVVGSWLHPFLNSVRNLRHIDKPDPIGCWCANGPCS